MGLAPYEKAEARLSVSEIANTGRVDRGFTLSIYFREPNSHRIELTCYKFEPSEPMVALRIVTDLTACEARLR